MSDEQPERKVLTPEEEATMIYSDRPILRYFDCPVVECDEVLPIHADVDLVLVLTPEEQAAGETDGPVRIGVIPHVYPDALELHLTLDHGVVVEVHHVSEDQIEDDDEGEDED